jgi:hypothetical protein
MKNPQFAQGRCRFGIAYGDITPPVGIYHRMWGAARHDRATGVDRPLRTSVLAFSPTITDTRTGELQILVALDHCVLGARELAILLEAVKRRRGIKPDQIAIVCSHTHAAGLLSLDRANLPGGELISDYLKSLAETTASAVEKSLETLQPATLVYGTGHCALAADRDYWDEKHQQYVCGYNPLVPADDSVLVVRAESDDGKILATIVNYACHPTTLAWDNTLISPDYPGAMREVVESDTNAPCVFLQGASGELGPREGFVGDPKVAERNGRELGYAALSVLYSLPSARSNYEYRGRVVSGATIGTWSYRALNPQELLERETWSVWRGTIDLPYRSDLPSLEEVAAHLKQREEEEAAARLKGDHQKASELRALAERRRRELARRQALPSGKTFPYQAAIWRMGQAIWLAVQGEPYSLLQTELRNRFPGISLVVCTIGFSWGAAYLPPAEKYGLGIYQETIAVVAPGSLETLIDALAQRIEGLLNQSKMS